MRTLISLCTMLAAVPALGAQATQTIDPGMSREQVVAKLGEPLSARSYGDHTYLLYRNGCERKCGMNDLVVLDSGKVVDAVFRSPGRHYTGTSSSPRMITESEARRGTTAAPLKTPAAATVKPPALKPTTKAAATKSPATKSPATKMTPNKPPAPKKPDTDLPA